MAGTLDPVLSPRNRELLGLVPSALLVTAGFTAIFIQAEDNAPGASTNLTLNHASSVSLTYGLLFLGLCLAAHLVIRFSLPYADPYLFPLVAVLASVGMVMVYRIDPVLARQQASGWSSAWCCSPPRSSRCGGRGWACSSATATRSRRSGSA